MNNIQLFVSNFLNKKEEVLKTCFYTDGENSVAGEKVMILRGDYNSMWLVAWLKTSFLRPLLFFLFQNYPICK